MLTLVSNRDARADDTALGGSVTLPFWTKAIYGSGDWSLASFGTLRQIYAGAAAIFLGLQALGWSGYQGPPDSAVHFGQSTPTLWVIWTMAGPVGAVLLIGATIMAWF